MISHTTPKIPLSRLNKGIYWTRAWTLVNGCTPVSDACINCWLTMINKRFHRHTSSVSFNTRNLNLPLTVSKPSVFCIWSDLFHEKISIDSITSAFQIMLQCPHHIFLILTKRPHRIKPSIDSLARSEIIDPSSPPPNIWLGTTIEHQKYMDRLDTLIDSAPYFNKLLSLEPLLSPLSFNPDLLAQIQWIVMGAESGPKARPTSNEWIVSIINQAREVNVKVFVKQIHHNRKNKKPELLKSLKQFPPELRVRELPESFL